MYLILLLVSFSTPDLMVLKSVLKTLYLNVFILTVGSCVQLITAWVLHVKPVKSHIL